MLVSVFVPFTRGPLEFGRALKQARRRDDDISIVTSSFALHLQPADADASADASSSSQQQQQQQQQQRFVIADVSLSFGGVAACTRSAPLCEAHLRGREFNALTFEGAYAALAQVSAADDKC